MKNIPVIGGKRSIRLIIDLAVYMQIVGEGRRDIDTGLVGGKVDEFRISDESKRAWSADDDYVQEQPLLIDPCDPADVALIMFVDNGEAIPRHNEQKRARLHQKEKFRFVYII